MLLFDLNITRFFLTAGSGNGSTELNSFDAALFSSRVADVNIVKMSSILPPNVEEVEPFLLPPGSLVPMAYASISRCKVDGLTAVGFIAPIISSAVAVGIPENPEEAGLIMELSSEGYADDCEETVRQMVIEGMAMRDRAIKDIRSISAELSVSTWGSTFAAVVLLP